MTPDISLLESAVYVGLCHHGLTAVLLSRMLHISMSAANGVMESLDAFGIQYPYAAVEPDYDMDGKVREKLESMLDRARRSAGVPPRAKYRKGTAKEVRERLSEIDEITGREFEQWCAKLLLANGFDTAEVTQYTGDAGVDVIAKKEDEVWAVQCKRYKHTVGNSAVQEVVAGMAMYGCQRSLIITSSSFTKPARKLAESNHTELWDRSVLQRLLQERLL